MKTTEITEEMINEFRQRVLKRVPKGKVLLATERYSPLHILKMIEKHKDIFVIKLYSHQTESGEDEVLIYRSKNSALKDTMDFINQQQSYNMDAGVGLEPTTS